MIAVRASNLQSLVLIPIIKQSPKKIQVSMDIVSKALKLKAKAASLINPHSVLTVNTSQS